MTRIYDMAMTHRLDADDLFIHQIQKRCAEAGMNFFLIEPLWVERFYELMNQGKVWPRVLLNMHSEHHQPKEIYHQLILLAARQNTQVIDPPDRALAAFDKALLHPRLMGIGLHVPYTVVVPAAQIPTCRLTEEDQAGLGMPFVIKPAMGYGRNGVILDATSPADLAQSAAAWPDAHYLLQERILPRELAGQPAYFRVFHAFGAMWPCWWNCFTDRYRAVTPEEERAHGLRELTAMTQRIADLTGMNFFSTEIALTAEGRFVVIDYVNDQCHMLSQAADPEKGVPNDIVTAIARRLVESAAAMIRHTH